MLGTGNTASIDLRLNGIYRSRFTDGIANATHREFILDRLDGRDVGSEIACTIKVLNSKTEILRAFCKLNQHGGGGGGGGEHKRQIIIMVMIAYVSMGPGQA